MNFAHIGSEGKESACSEGDKGDPGLVSELGRSPEGGNGNPLQHSYLRIPWTEEPSRLQSTGLQRAGHN